MLVAAGDPLPCFVQGIGEEGRDPHVSGSYQNYQKGAVAHVGAGGNLGPWGWHWIYLCVEGAALYIQYSAKCKLDCTCHSLMVFLQKYATPPPLKWEVPTNTTLPIILYGNLWCSDCAKELLLHVSSQGAKAGLLYLSPSTERPVYFSNLSTLTTLSTVNHATTRLKNRIGRGAGSSA
jgi:hypothetical protein